MNYFRCVPYFVLLRVSALLVNDRAKEFVLKGRQKVEGGRIRREGGKEGGRGVEKIN